jgi:hypothetical protein
LDTQPRIGLELIHTLSRQSFRLEVLSFTMTHISGGNIYTSSSGNSMPPLHHFDTHLF